MYFSNKRLKAYLDGNSYLITNQQRKFKRRIQANMYFNDFLKNTSNVVYVEHSLLS